MNKISTLLFFFLFLHTTSYAQCSLTINAYPYNQGFESGTGSWVSGGTGNDWALGTPSKAFITSAGGGTKCWVTGGLSGSAYTNGARSYVMSPCFDFTSLANPVISFKIYWDCENTYDGASFQSSIDNGVTWNNVGSDTDPTDCMTQNWFNNPSIINLATLANPKVGWAGSSLPTSGSCQGGGGSGGWVIAKHCLGNLSGQASVRFRFVFGAGTTCNNFDGVAFDDIKIENAPLNVANYTFACTNTSLQYQFTNSSTPCPNNFVWNFGDPASGTNNGTGVQNPTHTFSSAGTYTVTLTVSGPCNGTSTITKVISTPGLTLSTTNLPCWNSVSGSINATAVNSTGITNYSVQPGGTTNTTGLFGNLSPGTYTVSYTDASGCSSSSSTTITSAPAILWNSLTSTNITCNGLQNGKIIGTATGGTGAITYQLNPSGVTNITGSFTNLTAGTYTIIAQDANGCSLSSIKTIIEPSAINLVSATALNVLCHGATNGSLSIVYAGGTNPLTYTLNPIGATNSSGSFPNLGTGLFTITCTDVNGCSKSGVYTITEPTQLIINSITVTQPSCNPNNNGTAFINASGGTTPLNYSIGGLFGSNNFFGSMTSTTYNVVVKDGNGCTVSSSIVLQSLNAPSFQSVVEQDLTCAENQDGSIRVSANSNSTIQEYSLSPGGYINTNGNFTSLAAGTYIITVTDADGCTSTSQSVINAPDKLVINQVDYINDSCGSYAEGRLIFHVSGGTGSYTYQINPGAILQTTPIFTNLGIGDYRIQVTDANGCSTNSQVRITEKICCENVFMPNAFSPNNDGRNDEFAIRGTNGIELKDFLIFNRWGECVFKSRYLFDSWNGHYKGDDAEMGTYYYLVRYYCQSTGRLYTLKGDVILIR